MSNPEGNIRKGGGEAEAFRLLEEAVDAVVARMSVLEGDLVEARRQAAEMEVVLRKFTEGEEKPGQMIQRLRRLEEENEALLDRLNRGREGVARMLARIRFLEEQS